MDSIESRWTCKRPRLLWLAPLVTLQSILTPAGALLSAFAVSRLGGAGAGLLAGLLTAAGFYAAPWLLIRRVEPGTPALRALAAPGAVLLLEAALALILAAALFAPGSPPDLIRYALGYQSQHSLEALVQSLAYTPDGRWLVAADSTHLRFQPLAQPAAPRRIGTAEATAEQTRFSPDGRLVAMLVDGGALQVRRVSDGALLWRFGPVGRELSFSADGALLASVGYREPARVWRVADGRLLQSVDHAEGVSFAGFAPDNRLITRTFGDLRDELISAAASPDGRLGALGFPDGTLRVVDLLSGQTLWSAAAHRDHVYSLAFSADGALLASACGNDDARVRVWRAADGRQVALYLAQIPVSHLAFAPDRRTLAVAEGQRIMLWRLPELP